MRRPTQQEEEKVADLTPMLDVVFIMLIFFIVTASFVNEVGLGVNRPPTSDQPPPDSENTNIVFRISESNELTFEGRRTQCKLCRRGSSVSDGRLPVYGCCGCPKAHQGRSFFVTPPEVTDTGPGF